MPWVVSEQNRLGQKSRARYEPTETDSSRIPLHPYAEMARPEWCLHLANYGGKRSMPEATSNRNLKSLPPQRVETVVQRSRDLLARRRTGATAWWQIT